MSTSPSRFKPLYELGRGGMGAVDLAEDPRGQLVAVKRMLPELLRDERARGMFLREARLLARIDHPNVVRTLEIDAGDEETPPCLVMELIEGISLRDAMEASPHGVPIPIAARIAHGVATGLHAAHELCDERGQSLGVVHRDVSPHNVLVTFDGRVKLLDFGVAKTSEGTRTTTGEVKGKVAYMAPEQALADPVDRRSDLYALGALLYEMLTGRRMHGEGTDLEILRRMATERPKPISSLRPEVPAPLVELVERMTSEAPGDRPESAGEVATTLEPFARAARDPQVSAWTRSIAPHATERLKERVDAAKSAQELTRIARPIRPSIVFAVLAALAVVGIAAAAIALRQPAVDTRASASAKAAAPTTPETSASAVASVTPADPRVDLTFVVEPPKPISTHVKATPSAVKTTTPKVDARPF